MNYAVTIYETRSYSVLVEAASMHEAKAKGFGQWLAQRDALKPESRHVDFDECLVEPAALTGPLTT
jgi:hypothetical protein